MDDKATIRLSQVVKKLGISNTTLVEFLKKRGFIIEPNPNVKITQQQLEILEAGFRNNVIEKEAAKTVEIQVSRMASEDILKVSNFDLKNKKEAKIPKLEGAKKVGKLDLDSLEKASLRFSTKNNKKDNSQGDESNSKLVKDFKNFKKVRSSDNALDNSINSNQAIKILESKSIENEKVDKSNTHDFQQKIVHDGIIHSNIEEDLNSLAQKLNSENTTSTLLDFDSLNIPHEVSTDSKLGKISFEDKNKLQGLKVVGRIESKNVIGKSNSDQERPKTSTSQEISSQAKLKSFSVNKSKFGSAIANSENKNKKNKAAQSASDFKSKQVRFTSQKPSVVLEIDDKQIKENIRTTISQISQESGKATLRSKFKRQKRLDQEQQNVKDAQEALEALKVLKVNEFASANDLAIMMNEPVSQVISTCMSLGVIVAINQRLDSEIISLIAEEFGYRADFVNVLDEDESELDHNLDDLESRPPIVTIMGHVDHGKTSLLDKIHNLNVTKSESGGITQHIGAYDVLTKSNKKISFLDTPGHEAFTAMRSRGAKITDIVVIVLAADDGVMPQTKEAISHAQAAGVAIIIAINKVDKEGANPDRVKEQLANLGILVEEWGGKYQCQHVSAYTGEGIDDLLDKILLEAEVLDLKTSYSGQAKGIILESSIEKGKGYVSTLILQSGILNTSDIVVAGSVFGKIRAIKDCRGKLLKSAQPSIPVRIMGLEGAPQSGDVLKVMTSEKEGRALANKRQQLLREQEIRVKKSYSIDQVGKKLSQDDCKELKIIVKCDFDGSVEALSDSLLKLSTEKVKLIIVHKAVGAITESDVLLASATGSIIIGFHVRPIANAKVLANAEKVEIYLYSVIYDVIEKIRVMMENILPPSIKEEVVAVASILEIFKISKLGKVAGCLVKDGTLKKINKVKVIRNGVVKYTGKINLLKRFKDDVKEVKSGVECGLSLQGFSDFERGDIIESFEEKEIAGKL